MKQWGRIKIAASLKNKRVPPKIINKALQLIDEAEYLDTLTTLLQKKNAIMRENDDLKRKQKLILYAAGKGFEKDLIFDLLNSRDLL